MNDQLESIFQLPKPVKGAIVAGCVAVVAGAYYFMFYANLATEVASLNTAIDGPKGLRTQIAQKEGIAKNLDKYREEVVKLDGELRKALAELPDKKEIPQLLSRVSDKARDAGLEIRLFKPQAEQKKEFYSEVPVQLEVSGTFHQVATFFDEVGHLERIVNLEQPGMVDPIVEENNRVRLKTSVVATSFRFLEEAERPKDDEDKKGARRGSATKKGAKGKKAKAEES